MTDKELQKLNRTELLEMLVQSSRKIDELNEKIASLENTVEKAKQALNDRKLDVQKAGNFADASVKINGVFEAAEKAARQYMENVRRICEEKKALMDRKETESEEYCARIIREAELKCRKMEQEAAARSGQTPQIAFSGPDSEKKANPLQDDDLGDFWPSGGEIWRL